MKGLFTVSLLACATTLMSTQVSAANPDDVDTFNATNACRSCDLSATDFSNTQHQNADVTYSNISSDNFSGTDLTASVFKYTNAKNMIVQGATLANVDFSYASLDGTDFTGSTATDAVFKYAFMRQANLSGVFTNATFRAAFLSAAVINPYTDVNGVLQNSDFTGASFKYAYLAGADLTSTILVNTDFKYAYVTGAIFDNTDLTGSNITTQQLGNASSYCGATLPDGSQAPACVPPAPPTPPSE